MRVVWCIATHLAPVTLASRPAWDQQRGETGAACILKVWFAFLCIQVVLVKSDTSLGVYLHFQYYTYPHLFVINAQGITISLISVHDENKKKTRVLDNKIGLGRCDRGGEPHPHGDGASGLYGGPDANPSTPHHPQTHTNRGQWETTNLVGSSTLKNFLSLWGQEQRNFSPNECFPKMLGFEWRIQV